MRRIDKFKNLSLYDYGGQKPTQLQTPTSEKPPEQTVESNSYYKFHQNPNSKKNPHYFLGEELLVPRMNNTDTQRGNMFASHITQLVHLKNPEFPKVFTNFENQVGEYSIAYKKAKENFRVIAKIEKNQYNYSLIVQYKDSGVYDIINFNHAKNITEDYGYRVNDCIPDVKPGDTVKEGQWLYKSDNYDEDGNFAYGVNLKALFIPFKNMTYEDAIVISKSAAEKFTSFKTEKIMFSVNGNDVLLNLYGTNEYYKSFPHIGDMAGEKVLVASRRRDKRSVLYDFQADHLREIDPDGDEIIYTHGGKVVDINIYNNIPISELRKKKDAFNQEVLSILENQYRYWKEMAEELEKIIPIKVSDETEKGKGLEEEKEQNRYPFIPDRPLEREKNPNKYTDELAYYWKLAHENCDERIQWRFDGKSFENFKIEFTILKENPLTPGVKITGRFGNKRYYLDNFGRRENANYRRWS